MKRLLALSLVPFLACALLGAAPADAASFAIYATYWDTDELGDAFGGGLEVGIPLTDRLAFDIRASYYEELSDDPFDNLFDDEGDFFEDSSVEVIPVEIGLRYNFGDDAAVNPYLAGGAGVYFLDVDGGELDDEIGGWAAFGIDFGSSRGSNFFVEVNYRTMEGTIEDIDGFDEIDDAEVDDSVDIDLDGLGANAGVRWRFGG